ncbi:hypothetical protein, partial [Argonema antarcticum]|uniref:hypothetical protein n=1 Tax=Argonema antarcticum TaxID=2942763 RepID=UPI0020118DB4|nr:hypothetical protein [Argonema antarcticum A004/B2]
MSERTLRRYVKTLKKKLRSDFDYKPRQKGYAFETFQVLVKFCELRSTGMSPERAAEFISVHGV